MSSKSVTIEPYRVGQVVALKNGHRGHICSVLAATMPGPELVYYEFENGTSGAKFTIGHSEVVASSPEVASYEQAYRHGLVDGRAGRSSQYQCVLAGDLLREYVRGYNESATQEGFALIVSCSLRPTPGATAEVLS